MAKLKVIEQLVADTPNKSGRNNKKLYVTVHQTANRNIGANAQMHANLQSNGNSRAANWHWTVDDIAAFKSFTHDFQLWQAGDGGGDGNMNSISVEICVNSDGNYKKAMKNAAKLIKKIMKDEGISIVKVVQHNKWSGKHCPSDIRDGRGGITWKKLKHMVDGSKASVKNKKPSKKPASKQYKGKSVVDYLESIGGDSSFDNRAQLAVEYGIKNYKGTEKQNVKLLKKLRKGKPKKKKSGGKIVVGDNVTLSKSASNFATGQSIAPNVKGKKYKVIQVKSDRVLLEGIMSWAKKSDVSGGSGASKKKNKGKGTVHLPASSSSWRAYPTNAAPTKGNEKGFLNPAKFGGLSYKILKKPQANVVTIKTDNFGKVNIFVGKGSGAKIN